MDDLKKPNKYEIRLRDGSYEDWYEVDEVDKYLSHKEKEIEMLRGALEDAVSGYKYIEMNHGRLYGVGFDRVYNKAEQALGGSHE